jgi:hypothetical protein
LHGISVSGRLPAEGLSYARESNYGTATVTMMIIMMMIMVVMMMMTMAMVIQYCTTNLRQAASVPYSFLFYGQSRNNPVVSACPKHRKGARARALYCSPTTPTEVT